MDPTGNLNGTKLKIFASVKTFKKTNHNKADRILCLANWQPEEVAKGPYLTNHSQARNTFKKTQET